MEDVNIITPITMNFYEFADLVSAALTQKQHLELIKELDAYWGSYEFTHKILEYVLGIVNEDPDGYEQWLQDMGYEDTDKPVSIIGQIIDNLEDK